MTRQRLTRQLRLSGTSRTILRDSISRRSRGYTIVEVMVVLAVSGVMFIIAASFINGKQEKTAFTQSSTDLGSQLQTILNTVSNGDYVDQPSYCQGDGAGGINFNAIGSAQGINKDCVFVGKLLHIYKNGTTNPESYQTLVFAGARADDNSTVLANIKSVPNFTSDVNNPNNLDVIRFSTTTATRPILIRSSAGTTNSNSIGLALNVDEASGGTYQGLGSTASLIYATGLTLAHISPSSSVAGTSLRVAQSAEICVSDGRRIARIDIGGAGNNGNGLNVTVQQQGVGTTCTP